MHSILSRSLEDHEFALTSVMSVESRNIQDIATTISNKLSKGGILYIAGNGGSAADAQHFAAELIGRFKKERRPLAAIALTTDSSVITAVGNDYGYQSIFERQVGALVSPSDILLLISTSGNSGNLTRAADVAKRNDTLVLSLTGKGGGELKKVSDMDICVPSYDTARIQECHIFILHCLCELIEEMM